MQFLISVLHDTPELAPDDEMEAIDKFNDDLIAGGYWVFAGGLAAPNKATVIDNRRHDVVLTDGPFIESKEFVAGLWIWEAPDLNVALKLAEQGSKACNRRLEVRPFLSL